MRLRNILPLVALLAVPAMAQDAHFGFSVGISSPMGGGSDQTNFSDISLKDGVDKKIGFTLGANVGIEWQGGHVLRPRLDYTHHNGDAFGVSGNDLTVNSFQLGADYNYFVSEKASDGFYLLVGVGYANTKVSGNAVAGASTTSKSAFARGTGVGYEFTPMVGAELRYGSTHPDFSGTTLKNDTLNLSVTFRF
jgi:opacity protein-like surface antigen